MDGVLSVYSTPEYLEMETTTPWSFVGPCWPFPLVILSFVFPFLISRLGAVKRGFGSYPYGVSRRE